MARHGSSAALQAPEPNVIRIAAAIIDDGAGSILLVPKAGTAAFMQPGGKIEPGEARSTRSAGS